MRKRSFCFVMLALLIAGSLGFSSPAFSQTQNIIGTVTQVNSFNFGSQILLTQASTSGICFLAFPSASESKFLAIALTAQSANKQVYVQTDASFTCANYAWGNAYGVMSVN